MMPTADKDRPTAPMILILTAAAAAGHNHEHHHRIMMIPLLLMHYYCSESHIIFTDIGKRYHYYFNALPQHIINQRRERLAHQWREKTIRQSTHENNDMGVA